MENKKLDAAFKVVERNIQDYKAKCDLNSALSLAEAVDKLGEIVDDILDEEENVSNIN